MSQHTARVVWQHTGGDFTAGQYSRVHTWTFDGGISVQASPSTAIVKEPYSNPAAVDPEEAYVAAIASCHLLTFLHLASRSRFAVARYEDDAVGTMTKNERRVPWVSLVVLRPEIEFFGKPPSDAELERLHHEAHEQCFIANSVKTEIRVEKR